MLFEGELVTAGRVVLPEEKTLDRSVAGSEYSNDPREYVDALMSDTPDGADADGTGDDPAPCSLGSYVRGCAVLVTLARPALHGCSCALRLDVDAVVPLDDPGGGRGPDGCELPLEWVEASKAGYWW
jgi:hypothetical protein